MSTTAKTPPQTSEDPFCHCGYRRSLHGELRHACSSFSRSHFFNEGEVSDQWIAKEKALRAARAKANRTARQAH